MFIKWNLCFVLYLTRMFYLCTLLLFCLGIDSLLYASTIREDLGDSTVVLNKYKKYLSALDGMEFEYVTSNSQPNVATVRYNRNCFWTLIKTYENQDLKVLLASSEVAIVDFCGTIFRQDSRPPQNDKITITGILNPDKDNYTVGTLFDFPFLFGYYAVDNVNDVRYIPDLFQSSRVESVSIEKKQQIVLRKSEGDISLTLWIDPERSYAASKIKIERQNKKLQVGKTIRRELEVTDFFRISNIDFPKKIHEEKQMVGRTYEPKDGKMVEKLYITEGKRRYVEISDIQFNKPFKEKEFCLSSPIPDGTPVYMQDVPQIQYVWLDGRIVPKTDEVMLAIARGGHKFMPGTNEPRFWMMAIGIILILIGGGKMIYNHFNKKG